MAGLASLNALQDAEARERFLRCCGSARWADAMAAQRPFPSRDALHEAAEKAWWALDDTDRLEAFAHHPRIGGKDALRERFASTLGWAQGEQGRVAEADELTLEALAKGNEDYEKRFGRVFIVCATGKSAGEMLKLLHARLGNEPATELERSASEQAKITAIRLDKLLEEL